MTIRIQTVEIDDDGEGLVVTFSDGTVTGFIVEELLELRPSWNQYRQIYTLPKARPLKYGG